MATVKEVIAQWKGVAYRYCDSVDFRDVPYFFDAIYEFTLKYSDGEIPEHEVKKLRHELGLCPRGRWHRDSDCSKLGCEQWPTL